MGLFKKVREYIVAMVIFLTIILSVIFIISLSIEHNREDIIMWIILSLIFWVVCLFYQRSEEKIKYKELLNEKKIEYEELLNERKTEYENELNEQKVEYEELLNEQKVEYEELKNELTEKNINLLQAINKLTEEFKSFQENIDSNKNINEKTFNSKVIKKLKYEVEKKMGPYYTNYELRNMYSLTNEEIRTIPTTQFGRSKVYKKEDVVDFLRVKRGIKN